MLKLDKKTRKVRNMVKGNMFLVMLALLTVIAAGTAYGATDFGNNGVIKVTMVNQEPDPAEPGKYFDLRLKIENLGLDPLTNVVAIFDESYPFSMDPGDESSKNIGTLEALQKDDRAIIIKYKIRVDENAVEGTNKIKFKVRSETSEWSVYEFDISIRTVDANLAIESITLNPATVQPGQDAVMQIKIKNMADSTLKDITLKLDLLLTTISSGSTAAVTTSAVQGYLDVIPFAPVDSGTEKKIRQLAPGEEALFSFKLHAYPTAESRVYKIPIYLTYSDNLDTTYAKYDLVGIVVNSEPDIRVVLDSSTVTDKASSGKVTVKFVNKGLTNIKFLNVNLKPSDTYEITSKDETYVGKIDSDDYETAEFELTVKNAKDKILLPVHYEYMDANNNKYSKDIELELNLASSSSSASPRSNTTLYIIIGVVVVIIGFIIFRSMKKKGRKE
jgi:hypothetical protein